MQENTMPQDEINTNKPLENKSLDENEGTVTHEVPEELIELSNTEEKSNQIDEEIKNIEDPVDLKNADNEGKTDWEAKYKETYDQYLRLFSEFDNFRKRNARERIELMKTAGSEILTVILPVLDDFDRALKTMESGTADVASLKTGVDMIFQKLLHVLREKGLQPYDPMGEKFDPELHEAITHVPAQDNQQKGIIVDVIEKGYKMHEKVLRYPKVVVAQ